MNEIPEILNRADAAALLGVSVRHLDRLRDAGEILTQPIGRRRLVIRDSIGAYLARERDRLTSKTADAAAEQPAPDLFVIPLVEELRAQAEAKRAARKAA